MLRSIHNSRSGIAVSESSLNQTAHNLANLNTAAYKRSEMAAGDMPYHTLQERRMPYVSAAGLPAGGGVHPQAAVPFLGQGALAETESPLDLAISGEGYFRLLGPGGRVLYSRNGSFSLDAGGRVVNAAGYYLDIPFNLEQERGELSISPEGAVTMTSPGGEVREPGRISLYRFANPGGLISDGAGCCLESALSGRPVEGLPGSGGFGCIRQYCLEQSNSDTALEMVQLLLAQRALQANVRSLITADELQALILQVKP